MTAEPDPLGANHPPDLRDAPASGGPWAAAPVLVFGLIALGVGFMLGRQLLGPARPVDPVPPEARPVVTAMLRTDRGVTTGPESSVPAMVGQPAPPFRLDTPAGKAMALADLRGRPVLVNFFATWCGPCRAEMPLLQQAWERHKAAGLTILAVDVQEPPAQVTPYLRDLALSFPAVLDRDGAIADRYQVGTLPTSYLVGRDGRIAGAKVGFFPSAAALEQDLAQILSPDATTPGAAP
jgi:cytochrome c biogenesis protein CcmG, thiol:disulfide interchange protein DsbE